MKKLLVGLGIGLIMSISQLATADTWVNGYTKSNGTHVQGHYRSDRNGSVNDNWSTKGNYNPHTGKAGTKPRVNEYGSSSSKYKNRY